MTVDYWIDICARQNQMELTILLVSVLLFVGRRIWHLFESKLWSNLPNSWWRWEKDIFPQLSNLNPPFPFQSGQTHPEQVWPYSHPTPMLKLDGVGVVEHCTMKIIKNEDCPHNYQNECKHVKLEFGWQIIKLSWCWQSWLLWPMIGQRF